MSAANTLAPPMAAAQRREVVYAHAAIASMLQHAIPPSPQFYTIWYDYHAGENQLLRRVLDVYLTNGRAITEELLRELHQRFFDTRREAAAAQEVSHRLQGTMAEVAKALSAAESDVTRYGSSLRAFAGDLATPGDLVGKLHRMLAETQEMAERSTRLAQSLESSTRVVADLQGQLSAAQREARTDVLTGLTNRRGFDEVMAGLQADAEVKGVPLAVALFDIDRFKKINDTWGHPVGDAVLRRVAVTLQAGAQQEATCARFGGEEFIVLMPGLDLAAAQRAADAMRAAVEKQSFSVRATGQDIGTVTISAGVALFQRGEGTAAWLQRADAALYQAKQDGRNRVVVAA